MNGSVLGWKEEEEEKGPSIQSVYKVNADLPISHSQEEEGRGE